MRGVVRGLAHDVAGAIVETELSPSAQACAVRSLLNVIGVAIGAARHPAVDAVLAVAAVHGGSPAAVVPGRPERADATFAALATGVAAHVDDYDDTHLATVIHPSAATVAAALPVAQERHASGDELVRAFALGIEVQLRLGLAVSPAHYDEGWHITGTCGPIGAAVAAGLLLDLDADALAAAIGLASVQTLGQREAFGTHAKAFHPGKAAANGLLAGALAARGIGSPAAPLEAEGGLFDAFAAEHDSGLLTDGLGERFELERNTFKPYPCGIVNHPGIDTAIQLAPRVADVGRIVDVRYVCHPLVPELMGRLDPTDGLQARFSAVHGVAAGLADGAVGLAQYADDRVRAADLRRLRALVRLLPRPDVARDEAALEVALDDGEVVAAHVAHARGSEARPLSDDELDAKVRALVEATLPGHGDSVIAAVRQLPSAVGLGDLLHAISPDAREGR